MVLRLTEALAIFSKYLLNAQGMPETVLAKESRQCITVACNLMRETKVNPITTH